MVGPGVTIGILGASGLIGHALTIELQRRGHRVVPLARRFTPAQRAAHLTPGRELALAELADSELADALRDFDIVVNCLGVLQDAPGNSTEDIHIRFVTRLLRAMRSDGLLIQISVPQAGADTTAFSSSKRIAEAAIVASGMPYLILRPGFVLADAAYGGSALLRALAALPVALPPQLAMTPFAVTDAADIAATVAFSADARRAGTRDFAAIWDVFSDDSSAVGSVLEALRRHLGARPTRLTLPVWLLHLGARVGDIVSLLGWTPPIRSTALAEMERGIGGAPGPWRTATGIPARSIGTMLADRPATVQQHWFTRLFLLKPLIFGGLALFWIVSGLITLFPALGPATDILVRLGIPPGWAGAMAIVTSLADIAVGVSIAIRRTSRAALALGLAVAAFYLLGAAVLAPGLWLDPLGSLVKTIPAILLMLVALAIWDNR